MNVSFGRSALVWCAVSGAAAAVATWSLAGVRPTAWAGRFDLVLADVAALALAGCAVWAWLVTTVVVAEALRGRSTRVRPARGVPDWARRAVLAACGAALVVGVPATVASADPGTEAAPPGLSGLPFPDRALGSLLPPTPPPTTAGTAGTPDADERHGGRTLVVRPGDSLWSLAEEALGTTESGRVAAAVAALHRANHDVVGADPDLIHPGQHLRLPAHLEETR